MASADTTRFTARQPNAQKRLRVALIAHDIHEHGGMERAFAELIRRTHEEVDFVVISGRLANHLRPLVKWNKVPLPQRPFPLKYVVFFLAAGLRLRSTSRDIAHTMGAIVPNRADVACVQFCHAGFVTSTGRLAPAGASTPRRLNTGFARMIGLAAERWCYQRRRLRQFAAVSRGVAAELTKHYAGVPVTLTPNGVDPEVYRPDAATRRELRGEHGLGDDEIIALFVGGDWSRKGLDLAIKGLAEAAARLENDIRLWVVGSGDVRRFQALADAHEVGEYVQFMGPSTHAERFFQAADIFLLPTLYETFSLVAYEAAACGLPLVATHVSGIDDLASDGQAGILVERDPGAIADALVRLGADRSLRSAMGSAGREFARQYTWERSAETVLALYQHLMLNRQGAPLAR